MTTFLKPGVPGPEQQSHCIATELGIILETVRDNASVLLRKLEASNRTEAVAKALAMGLTRQ